VQFFSPLLKVVTYLLDVFAADESSP